LVLCERNGKPRIAAHFEQASRRVAVHVERNLECAWRDVGTAIADVVGRNRELNRRVRPRCAASSTTAPAFRRAAAAAAATTTTTFLAASESTAARSCWRRNVPKI